MTHTRALTMIELLIVVAIIGALAAIAIPNFVEMTYRAKRAEVPENVTGIHTAQIAYEASYDVFLDLAATPVTAPSKNAVAWDVSHDVDWERLGWSPDGKVRGQYSTLASDPDFILLGTCDVDGDGSHASYTSTKNYKTALNTAADVY